MKYWLMVAMIALPLVAAADERPNFLLLMAEDLGPRIGAFGDNVAVTPNIDRLAQQGVRYLNTYTAAGVCAPSRAAIISGMHQESIGAQHMRSYSEGPAKYYAVPPPQVKAFPELLRARGYYTFNRRKLDYQFSHVRSGSGPFSLWDSDSGGNVQFEKLPSDQPFFGYVNFLGTHESGIFAKDAFPKSIAQLYTQLKQISIHWDTEDQVLPQQVDVPPYYPDTPKVRKDIARQYNNLITVDRQVGEVLAQLEKSGLADNTIVIWTTDHGDGLPRAKRELYDSGIKVPMVIRWPEKYRPQGVAPGGVDERMISLVDLAPTLLTLAGVSVPDYVHGQPFAGASSVEPREYIFAARDRIGGFADRQRAVRDQRFKYIRSYNLQPGGFHLAYRDNIGTMQELWRLLEAGQLNEVQRQWFQPRSEEMLFDTREDPHEINNLANDPKYTAELERLRSAYEKHRARVPDLSDDDETQLAQRSWPDEIQPVTQAPEFRVLGERVSLISATEGASIGYRTNGGDWQLYTGPLRLKDDEKLEGKAVRYGWKESEVAELQVR
ncbi:sulfatase-like hydrolase/transferase [Pseudomaricurvus alkylphenolicus]|uniref:sulfatase-like hydrolase/transferase n=1 Tax=Pseudomaricurvus alkylphenolicus TaxID=1306991 RepID=UPI00142246E0|nr:sulfatase-like hydrolase/transferase [Pseudomaricurvus alkylphenolicus]NIB38597.1 sulfatase-like hydrolase/transferase [Pseudomaricurvus alkylphenolicus]